MTLKEAMAIVQQLATQERYVEAKLPVLLEQASLDKFEQTPASFPTPLEPIPLMGRVVRVPAAGG